MKGEAAGPEGTAATQVTQPASILPRDARVRGLTPFQGMIFDNWLEGDSEPLGGRPTGGVEQAEANADKWWMDRALEALRAEAKTGRVFEMFDLVARYGLPEPDHSARFGALVRVALREGTVHRVGYGPSKRPSRNRGVTGLYQGIGWSSW